MLKCRFKQSALPDTSCSQLSPTPPAVSSPRRLLQSALPDTSCSQLSPTPPAVSSWRELPQAYHFCRDKTTRVCRDKSKLVATNLLTNILLSRQTCFVATKHLSPQKCYLWQLPPMILQEVSGRAGRGGGGDVVAGGKFLRWRYPKAGRQASNRAGGSMRAASCAWEDISESPGPCDITNWWRCRPKPDERRG